MSQKILLPLLLLAIIMFSCRKEEEEFNYEIQGIDNVDSKIGETKILDLSVVQTGGTPEEVTLTIKEAPQGVTCSIETEKGKPNYSTSLAISTSQFAKMGTHSIIIEATSQNLTKQKIINFIIDDNTSMTMKVYNATQWSLERPAGEADTTTVVKLYSDSLSFARKNAFYTASTDKDGVAYFYHVPAGVYLFTVENINGLSNVVSKRTINGVAKGFVVSGIDLNTGKLKFFDENNDGFITDADRAMCDLIVIRDKELTNKVIWIGK